MTKWDATLSRAAVVHLSEELAGRADNAETLEQEAAYLVARSLLQDSWQAAVLAATELAESRLMAAENKAVELATATTPPGAGRSIDKVNSPISAVLRAWKVEGRSPSYHRKQKDRLRGEWPSLYNSLSRLVYVYGGGNK